MASVVFIDFFFPREHFNPARINNINHIAHIIIIGLSLSFD